jgi:hypothetical protein
LTAERAGMAVGHQGLGAAALALASVLLLGVMLDATHRHTVAGADWVVPLLGLSLPWLGFQVVMPLMLGGALLLVQPGLLRREPLPAGAWAASVRLLVLVSLVLVWALHLVRHDRLLTALHVALVVVACMACIRATPIWRRAWWRGLTMLGAVGLLAGLSYGALWGEARCGRLQELPCIRDSGIRVWVPSFFDALGVEVFADLRGADLQGVVLAGRDLRLADLRDARLTGADLSGANLRRARLDGIQAEASKWRGAMMDGASFRGAGLRGADLRGIHAYLIDLTAADLTGADISGGSLSHAVLHGTRMQGAAIAGAYLRFSRGWTHEQLRQATPDAQTRLPDGAAGP